MSTINAKYDLQAIWEHAFEHTDPSETIHERVAAVFSCLPKKTTQSDIRFLRGYSQALFDMNFKRLVWTHVVDGQRFEANTYEMTAELYLRLDHGKSAWCYPDTLIPFTGRER